jgi:hypothetical protein
MGALHSRVKKDKRKQKEKKKKSVITSSALSYCLVDSL